MKYKKSEMDRWDIEDGEDVDPVVWKVIKFKVHEMAVNIVYSKAEEELFDFEMKVKLPGRTLENELYNATVYDAVLEIAHLLYHEKEFLMLQTKYYETVLKAAKKSGDEVFVVFLKHGFRKSNAKDVKIIEDVLGKKVLPALPKKYDRYYIVDANSADIDLLKRSGYKIWKRPDYSMEGYSHDMLELDPYTRDGQDAAKCDSKVITFEQYLKLFDRMGGI